MRKGKVKKLNHLLVELHSELANPRECGGLCGGINHAEFCLGLAGAAVHKHWLELVLVQIKPGLQVVDVRCQGISLNGFRFFDFDCFLILGDALKKSKEDPKRMSKNNKDHNGGKYNEELTSSTQFTSPDLKASTAASAASLKGMATLWYPPISPAFLIEVSCSLRAMFSWRIF